MNLKSQGGIRYSIWHWFKMRGKRWDHPNIIRFKEAESTEWHRFQSWRYPGGSSWFAPTVQLFVDMLSCDQVEGSICDHCCAWYGRKCKSALGLDEMVRDRQVVACELIATSLTRFCCGKQRRREATLIKRTTALWVSETTCVDGTGLGHLELLTPCVVHFLYLFRYKKKQDTFCWSCNVAALRICRDEATRLCCSALRICRCWDSCEYMWVSVFRGGSSVQELLVASMATQDGCLLSPPTNSIATRNPRSFQRPSSHWWLVSKEDAFWSSSQQSESVWFQIFGSKDLLTTLPLRYLTKTKHVVVAVR